MKTFEVILVNNTDNRQEKITQIKSATLRHAMISTKKYNPGWIIKSVELI